MSNIRDTEFERCYLLVKNCPPLTALADLISQYPKVLLYTLLNLSFFFFSAIHINRQSSTSSLPTLDKSWYGDIQPITQTIPQTPLAMPAPLAATLSHSSSGSSVLAAAASQAIAATQQVKLVLIRKMLEYFN